jgi:hypothetical protein
MTGARSIVILSFAFTSAAADLNTLSADERAAGWRLLFDGKSLAGWLDPATRNPPGDSWRINAGVLVGKKNPRILEDLTTVDSFRDFEFMFDWRVEAGGNSGVKYRAWESVFLTFDKPGWSDGKVGERATLRPDQYGQIYNVAYEFQLLDDERHPDAKNGADRRTGALYGFRAPTIPANAQGGQWHTARLVVSGSRVEHWNDGVSLLSADLQDPEIIANVQKRWARRPNVWQKFLEMRDKPAPISLQNHGDSVVEFRNLKLRTR